MVMNVMLVESEMQRSYSVRAENPLFFFFLIKQGSPFHCTYCFPFVGEKK